MAEVVKGIIDVEINTGTAASQLKALQQQINSVFLSLNKGNATASSASKAFASDLADAINSSRVFTAEQVKMRTAAGALDDTLRKGQATLRNYFSAKYVKNGALFAETLDLSRKRAALLQTQFIATGAASRGMQDALAIKPLQAFASQAAIAAQRTQILSSMFRQGTTQLINFGKNVQWAGRQLMVGFTVPLTIFGTTAGRVFRELEMQVVSFKKVYGDLFTTPQELNENLQAVQDLAREYTKYGVAVKDTIGLAAQAAAAGRRNADLTDAVTQATRLSTLGQMDQNQALETTIALQSAFQLSGEELANSINFLNMVENQTVVSLQDLAAAIPRVAPVIKGLGGDVKDLSVFLAAMQEGGVSAEQGANALKSGLASLINPTKNAKEVLGGFGINLEAIINANRGDLMKTVMGFAQALKSLDEFSRQQALEEVFGKFQYARLGALFENIVRDGSQASQVMDTMGYSVEELRQTADKELSTIEQAFSVQLQGAIERFKLSIAPIGEIFVRLAIPLVNFATRIADAFNNLPDFQKKFIAFATIITGLVIPAGTMFFGLLMNLTGTLARIVQFMGAFGKGFVQGGIVGAFKNASQSAKYFSSSEIEAALAAQQLGSATEFTNSALRRQMTDAMGTAGAINYLSDSYGILLGKMMAAAEVAPFTMGIGQTAAGLARTGRTTSGRIIRPPQMRNSGGPIFMESGAKVPGFGNKDTVPAMLTPGEFVVNKKATQGNFALLQAINNSVQKFNDGGLSVQQSRSLSQGERATSWLSPIAKAVVSSTGLGGTYSKYLMPQSQKLLSNTVYALQSKYNQSLNGRFAYAGGYGLPVKTLEAILAGKSRVDNPYIYLDEYARRSGITYDKTAHSSALLGELRSRASGAPAGYQVRVVDGPEALSRAMAQDKTGKTFYIRLDEIFKSNRVQSSLPGGLLNVLSSTSTARGSEFIKKLGKVKSGNTKALSKAEQAALGKAFTPSFMSLRRGGRQNLVAQYLSNFGKGYTQATHFMANGGRVPAMLTPGEYVVNKNATKSNLGLLHAINNGTMSGYNSGGKVKGMQYFATDQENRIVQELSKLNMGVAGPTSQIPRQSRFGRLRGLAGPAAMGASFLLPMIGSQMQQSSNSFVQSVGGFVNLISPAAMALSLFPQIITKLMGPWGLLISGVIGIGVAIKKYRESIDKASRESAKQGAAAGGAANALDTMAKILQQQTPLQQLLTNSIKFTEKQLAAQEQSYAALQTEQGQAFVEQIKNLPSDQRVSQLVSYVQAAIASGMMDKTAGSEFARVVGAQIGDQLLGPQVIRQIMGQRTGSAALLGLAQQRTGYREFTRERVRISRSDLVNPNAGSTRMSVQDAGYNVGLAIQSFKSASEAQALASLELQRGAITQAKYNEILAESNRLQLEAQKQMESAIANTADKGGTAQAIKDQLTLAGFTAEQIKVIEENVKKITDPNKAVQLQLQVATGQINPQDLPVFIEFLTNKNNKVAVDWTNSFAGSEIAAAKFAMWASANLTESGSSQFRMAIETVGLDRAPELQKLISVWGENSSVMRQFYIDIKAAGANPQETLKQFSNLYENLGSKDASKVKEATLKLVTMEGGNESTLSKIMNEIKDYNNMSIEDKISIIQLVVATSDTGLLSSKNAQADMTGKAATLRQQALDQIKALQDSMKQALGGEAAGTGEKSQIQLMLEAAKATKEYANALRILAKDKQLSNQQLSEMDEALAIEIANKGRKERIKLEKTYKDMLENRKNLQYKLMTEEEKELKRMELSEKIYSRQIELINRRIDLKQKDIDVESEANSKRQRALNEISKQEEKVNEAYNVRLDALDKIDTANQRNANRERSRIDLASALASGDIASAARTASQINQEESRYKIEDARAALEKQKQSEIAAITFEVNGIMMTRAQIEEAIAISDEKIYNIQEQIKQIELEKIPIMQLQQDMADKRYQTELNILQTMIDQMNRAGTLSTTATPPTSTSTGGGAGTPAKLTGQTPKPTPTPIPKYTPTYSKSTPISSKFPTVTYGNIYGSGSGTYTNKNIPKMSSRYFGGLMNKGSNEAPPALKMAYGSIVPGLGNSDRVPALLTPGEFVIRKSVASAYMPLLETLNNQTYPMSMPKGAASNSSNMYNTYSVNVNVAGTNASPDEIANAVMSKIKSVENRSLRSVKVVK